MQGGKPRLITVTALPDLRHTCDGTDTADVTVFLCSKHSRVRNF